MPTPPDSAMHPDLTTVVFQYEPGTRLVTARGGGAWAESILHRAGLVPVVLWQDRYHRLPEGMTDPAEQRELVAGAAGALASYGFTVSVHPDLSTGEPLPQPSLVSAVGSQLTALAGKLAGQLADAGHTRDAVAVLDELTAPMDGVLAAVVDTLQEAASWWETLGEPLDRRYAQRLRYIADTLDGYAREVRSLRGDLADRHTEHPYRGKAQRAEAAVERDARLSAARAASPAARTTAPAQSPPTPSLGTGPAAQRPTGPRR